MLLDQTPHTGRRAKRSHFARGALIALTLTVYAGGKAGLGLIRPTRGPLQQTSAEDEVAVVQWIRANAVP
jgi:hypothetical protein